MKKETKKGINRRLVYDVRRIELFLRGTDAYHIAVDREAKISLGMWLRWEIKRAGSRPYPKKAKRFQSYPRKKGDNGTGSL